MENIEKHTFYSDVVSALIQEALAFFDGTPFEELPLETPFNGAGVYALYYRGEFEHYAFYRQKEKPLPIYIGKAVPQGWRQGRLSESQIGRELFRRIREHAKNIGHSGNLEVNDFQVRYMIFKEETVNLVSTIESALIRQHSPLWNSIIDGFGNHDPGKGRYNQAVSEWDFLHPGRIWVERLTGQKPELKQILEKIKKYTGNMNE